MTSPAVLGLPGGAEWGIIIVVVLTLFAPAVILFLGGYAVGRSTAKQDREVASAPPDAAASEAGQDTDTEDGAEHG